MRRRGSSAPPPHAVSLDRRWRAFVEGINLTNAPVRYTQVETMRPVQVEYYEPVLRFGLRASF